MYKKALLLVVCWTIACGTVHGQAITFVRDFSQGGGGFGGVGSFVLDGTDIYVTGRFFAAPYHAFLGKYGPEGQQHWVRPFLVPAAGYPPLAELSGGLAVTPHGIYVTATARTSRGDFNIFLRKYASDGTDLWILELDFSTQDFAGGVAADESGIYITGQIGTEGVVRKYDFDGVEQWTVNLISDLAGRAAMNVVVDSNGVYVALNRVIRKYDASGNEIWTRELPEKSGVGGLTVYGDNIFVVGTERTPFTDTNPSFLRAFNLGGDPILERRFGPDLAAAVAVDATGIYVGGTASAAVKGNCRHGTQDAVVRKFEADGAESWARQFGFFGFDSVRTMAINNAGLYTAGRALARVDKNPEVVDRARPQILDGCIVNAASLVGGGVAPGEMVTIMGTGLGPLVPAQQRRTEEGLLVTRLSETSVFFDGIAAPLISVSDKQSTVIVPYEVTGRSSVSVQVEFQGTRSEVSVVPVFLAKPGIFTRDGSGQGQAEAFNEDGTPNSATNPAPRRSIITFYATGEGSIDPPVVTGSFIGTSTHRPQLDVNVGFDAGCEGALGEVISAVEKTGSPAGLLEVRARVPEWANFGDAVGFSMSLETPLPQSPRFSAGSSSSTSVAISETRIATDLAIAPAVVFRGDSFAAMISGPNFDNKTYLDVRYRRPKSNADEIAFNWQIGTTATHLVTQDTELGTWTITGIRAHSNMNDRSGEFLPVSATIEVMSPN